MVIELFVGGFSWAFALFLVDALCIRGLLIMEMRIIIDGMFVDKEIFYGDINNLLNEARKIMTDEDSIG